MLSGLGIVTKIVNIPLTIAEKRPRSPLLGKNNILLAVIQMLTTGTSQFYHAHKSELQHFVDCLIKDKKPTPTGEDGLKDLEAIEKAYKNQIMRATGRVRDYNEFLRELKESGET
jgi:hypothetical protein